MRSNGLSEEQIIAILKERFAGVAMADFCRHHGISSAIFCKYRAKYDRFSL